MRPKVTLNILIVLSLVLLMGSITFSETIAQSDKTEEAAIPAVDAGNITGNQLYTVAGGPGFITVSGHKFVISNLNDPMGRNGPFIYNPRETTITYFAPIDPPNGATIKKIVAYYYDSVTPTNLTVRLDIGALSDGSWASMAQTTSSGNSGLNWTQADVTAYEVVDLQDWYYYISVTIPGGNNTSLGLYSVRVDYEYPGYIPLVTK